MFNLTNDTFGTGNGEYYTIEYILLDLLETDHLPDRENSMALIADVYVYNG